MVLIVLAAVVVYMCDVRSAGKVWVLKEVVERMRRAPARLARWRSMNTTTREQNTTTTTCLLYVRMHVYVWYTHDEYTGYPEVPGTWYDSTQNTPTINLTRLAPRPPSLSLPEKSRVHAFVLDEMAHTPFPPLSWSTYQLTENKQLRIRQQVQYDPGPSILRYVNIRARITNNQPTINEKNGPPEFIIPCHRK